MTDTPQAPDLVAVKGRQQQAWSAGDYSRVGSTLVIMAELLCEAVDVHPGEKVLDVAGGSGNVGLAAARRFADVTCTDYVPALLDVARRRADAENLTMACEVADAEALPYPDGSFDIVMSAIGAMFAPNQEQTARELVRVCRPGGKIGMANWTPDGFVGEFFKTISSYAPPPPGVKPPSRWGTEDGIRELLGDGVGDLKITRRDHMFRYLSPEFYVSYFEQYFGPFQQALARLDAAGQQQLKSDVMSLIGRYNRADDGSAVWPGAYLEVVAVRA